MNRLCSAAILFALAILHSTGASHAAEPVRVACVGDSITQGVGIQNPQKDGYPAKLQEILGAGWTVQNFGVGGRTMLRKADPFDHRPALESSPDIVIIALGTNDVYRTVDGMKKAGVAFQDTIETYYDLVDKRLPNHGEQLAELKRLRILIDGATHQGAPNELLLQIFTQTVIGPIFFEIIQRKGNEGFGEGNFQALFESIERDQMKRGVL